MQIKELKYAAHRMRGYMNFFFHTTSAEWEFNAVRWYIVLIQSQGWMLIPDRQVCNTHPTWLMALQVQWKKSAQRRRKHCALAVVRRSQKISPRCRPLPGGAGQPKFNQLEMVTNFTYKPSLVRIDAHNFELSW